MRNIDNVAWIDHDVEDGSYVELFDAYSDAVDDVDMTISEVLDMSVVNMSVAVSEEVLQQHVDECDLADVDVHAHRRHTRTPSLAASFRSLQRVTQCVPSSAEAEGVDGNDDQDKFDMAIRRSPSITSQLRGVPTSTALTSSDSAVEIHAHDWEHGLSPSARARARRSVSPPQLPARIDTLPTPHTNTDNADSALPPRWSTNRRLFVLAYAVLHLALFLYQYFKYAHGPNVRKARAAFGPGLPVARGAALCLCVDASLLVLTMCRKTVTWLRRWRLFRALLPVDEMLWLHKWTAFHLLLFTIIHLVAHITNYTTCMEQCTGAVTVSKLLALTPSWTGIIATLLLLVIASFGALRKRLRQFEWFAHSHWLFAPFYLLLMVHGTGGLIRTDDGHAVKAMFWAFIAVPGLLFAAEHYYRAVDARAPVDVVGFRVFDGNVLELCLVKPRWMDRVGEPDAGKAWKYRPGQYVYVRCPDMSKIQSHPFSITSAPSDPHLKLAIHCKGDWTGALRDRFDLADFARKLPPSPLNSPAEVARLVPAIELDGPFDTAATDFADRDVAVFVAAGVGITPFMSCLRWLMHELTSSSSSSSSAHLPRRVHLIWTVRDATHFTWFNSTLRALESDPRLRDTITLHLHCTGNKDRDAPAPIAHGLKLTPAHAGRPDLGAVLTGVREEARGMVSAVDGRHASVGVYCVGPAALCADVRKVSWRLSEDATPFTVHCEQS